MKRKYYYGYYRCRKYIQHGDSACSHRKNHRAESLEVDVWEFVSDLLQHPERLQQGLREMIEQEHTALRGDPEQVVKAWLDKLSEVDQERRGYLRLAAKGHMGDEELDEALRELEDTRETVERELRAIQGHREIRARQRYHLRVLCRRGARNTRRTDGRRASPDLPHAPTGGLRLP